MLVGNIEFDDDSGYPKALTSLLQRIYIGGRSYDSKKGIMAEETIRKYCSNTPDPYTLISKDDNMIAALLKNKRGKKGKITSNLIEDIEKVIDSVEYIAKEHKVQIDLHYSDNGREAIGEVTFGGNTDTKNSPARAENHIARAIILGKYPTFIFTKPVFNKKEIANKLKIDQEYVRFINEIPNGPEALTFIMKKIHDDYHNRFRENYMDIFQSLVDCVKDVSSAEELEKIKSRITSEIEW